MKRATLAFLCCILASFAPALAGTTGVLSGTVCDDNGKPVADVAVRIVSPTDQESTQTDAHGFFAFLHLAPDTYTVAMEKQRYTPVSYAGVTVFADNTLALRFKLEKQLITISDRCFECTYFQYRPRRDFTLDLTLLEMQNFSNFDNPVAASLSTVPGVLVTSGGGYMD